MAAPKPNAKGRPDEVSVIWWIIRGLGGVVSMLEALGENGTVLDHAMKAELRLSRSKLANAFKDLDVNEDVE